MVVDRLIGILALACLAGFLAVLGSFVREPALIVVLVIGVIMAGYDFWLELFGGKSGNGKAGSSG